MDTLETKSMDQVDISVPLSLTSLMTSSKGVIYPDSAPVVYEKILREGIGKVDKSLKIGIVGAGISGLTCAYECLNLRDEKSPKDVKISVDIFENDPEHFFNNIHSNKAGRIFAYNTGSDNYELGAMRIPKKAVLTWYYTSLVSDNLDDTVVDIFPNPGFVPAMFVFDDVHVGYLRGRTETQEFNFVVTLVRSIKAFMMGDSKTKTRSLFPIGGFDPSEVSRILSGETSSITNDKDQVLTPNNLTSHWERFKKEHDHLSLRGAVTRIIHEKIKDLPDLPATAAMYTEDHYVREAYFVRLIGHLGFGSGGFCTMYSMAFVDYMREALWNDDTDYLLPFTSNSELPKGIYSKIQDKCRANKRLKMNIVRAVVTDVFHSDNNKPAVIHHNIPRVEDYQHGMQFHHITKYSKDTYDYVILAVPPVQVSKILSSTIALKEFCDKDFSDKGFGMMRVKSPFLPGPATYANKMWPSLLGEIYMVSASKSFVTVYKAIWEELAPGISNEIGTKDKIRSVIFENGLGVLYTLPGLTEDKLILLISYSWEEESRQNQSITRAFPGSDMSIEHVLGIVKRAGLPWLEKIMLAHDINILKPYSYSWSGSSLAGAFKAGRPGDVYINDVYSNVYKYLAFEGYNICLAGEPYARMGGWIESAFMSSINAVAAIAKSMATKHPSCTIRTEADKLFN